MNERKSISGEVLLELIRREGPTPILATTILRHWSRGRIQKFVAHLLVHAAQDETESRCEWVDREDYWQTQCGDDHCFTADGPAQNRHRYCPYCGDLIMVVDTRKGGDLSPAGPAKGEG